MEKSKKIRIAERIGVFIGTLLLVYILFRFATYFMPFLIAGIIAVLIEPLIKFCMNKLRMSRRMSSVIVVGLTIICLLLILVFGGRAIIKEITRLTENITTLLENKQESQTIKEALSIKIKEVYPGVTGDILESIWKSVVEVLQDFQSATSGIISIFMSFPTIIINTVITILALIFFTKDRIYVIDTLEHHMPKSWLKKLLEVGREVFSTIGGYIRVYAKILLITFAELYLAFNIMIALGFNIPYPLLLAILVAIVDILPILGVGTVLIPWAIIMFIFGQWEYALALLITYGVIFVMRQFIEPRLVSKQFGIHPLITLFAMYAGYRTYGVFGLILGPIILMILRCLFAPQIEKGLFKDMFEEK